MYSFTFLKLVEIFGLQRENLENAHVSENRLDTRVGAKN